ncbi:YibE/F family protein [Streptomyces sioyaensis]|uniref:YibE/F family protein n=1 Tax=Streptomyces sioyaensis TaxID=67364 RepID=A0A4Q1R7L6_9ACTN|nr:YibE/F family protein [Streptomyces sioyaensis]MBM4794671.1 YibE/F family protein [Streptomyces sioyaensis]RXS69310.1 YibE/F family protein [Streptomyces sioyaensis]
MPPHESHRHSAPHSHGHGHGPAAPVSRHLRKVIAAVLIPFAAAVAVGLLVLWPGGAPPHKPSGVGFDQPTERARVTEVAEVNCADVHAEQQPQPPSPGGQPPTGGADKGKPCQQATIEVTTGENAGRTFKTVVTPDALRHYTTGQDVVVAYSPKAPKELQYAVSDVDRSLPMWVLAAIFALAVVLVGRLRGVLALVALAASFVVLTLFILPAILQGSNPLVVAVVGGSAIMLIALYLCHGLTARTSVAVLGTLASLLLIGLLGSVFINWALLTGNTDDTTGLVHGLFPDIEIRGLLLAGIIIGSLGVLDDVTVTQTAAVWELKEADPSAGWRKLYGAAMRIGRDHIASVVNTLVLAYAGAALPLLLLFSIAQSSVGTVATSEVVAEEIVRTLVGSIGLVAAVPLTTLLAALVVSADRREPGLAEVADMSAEGEGSGVGTHTGEPIAAGGLADAMAGPKRRRGGHGRRRKR